MNNDIAKTTLLKFTPFEKIPRWDSINEQVKSTFSQGMYEVIFNVRDRGYSIFAQILLNNSNYSAESFDNNLEGYKNMCNWLNEKKLLTATAFCR